MEFSNLCEWCLTLSMPWKLTLYALYLHVIIKIVPLVEGGLTVIYP